MPLQKNYGVLVVAWAWPEDLPAALPEKWRSIFDARFNGDMLALNCPMRQDDVGEDSSKRHRSHGACVTFSLVRRASGTGSHSL